MRLSLGEWKLRDGDRAVVVAYDQKEPVKPFVGYIVRESSFNYRIIAVQWRSDGHAYAAGKPNSDSDIVGPWEDPKKMAWIDPNGLVKILTEREKKNWSQGHEYKRAPWLDPPNES